MDKEQLAVKERVLALITASQYNKKYLDEQIERLSSPQYSSKFYSGLLELFIHLSLEEEEAKGHWKKIFENYEYFSRKLDHDVGLPVAIFDYFINLNKMLTAPILVEIHLFRETEKMAMLDGLTGLYNRRCFDINLMKELNRSIRYDKDLSLLMLDLDNFKEINDSRGHVFGDEVLVRLARHLLNASRMEDMVCRYGGEEFIIILPETASRGAMTYAERMRSSLKEESFFEENNITISGGISSFPYCGLIAKQLVDLADKALYAAKAAGKDRIVVTKTDNMRRRMRHQQSWKLYCQLLEVTAEEKKVIEGVTQNVSLGGLGIETDEEWALDTKLLLKLEMPDDSTIMTVGKIVWAGKKNGRNSYGIQFCDLQAEQIDKMRRVLPNEFHVPEG